MLRGVLSVWLSTKSKAEFKYNSRSSNSNLTKYVAYIPLGFLIVVLAVC